MIKALENSAMESLELNLNYPNQLVDNRDSADWLNFIARFAGLINFYDKNNTLDGNWAPFILKDPFFLAITMSKTDTEKQNNRFRKSCTSLNTAESQKKPAIFNQLFDNILSVFRQIEAWTAAMQLTPQQYELKTHTLSEVKDIYSPYLWAFLELRLYLSKNNSALLIVPPYMDRYQNYDAIIWKTNKDKRPFWEVLGQDSAAAINNPNTLQKVLSDNGNRIFSFFKSLREMAQTDLVIIGHQSSPFPDTLLLRSFIEVMRVNQLEMNSLSQNHLDFYYADILKQIKKTAQPDSVFISLVLAKTNATYNLNTGTLFSAGLDADKNPILFETIANQSINPALIKAVHTLTVGVSADDQAVLYRAKNSTPSTLQKDVTGAVTSWNTFGNNVPDSTNSIQTMGLALATPMLLLEEGQRQIVVTLVFYNKIDVTTLNKAATFALSTTKAWFEPLSENVSGIAPAGSDDTWQITITLDISDPPIVPFAANTDGYQSNWPLLRLMFGEYPNLELPPLLKEATFNTQVTGIRSFTLSNDNGSLNPAKPFQLFGPIVNLNAAFYIGQPELFSKDLDNFTLELDWDALPADFKIYYDVYNKYLQKELKPIAAKPKLTAGQKLLSGVTLGMYHPAPKSDETKEDSSAEGSAVISGFNNPFEDDCFKVNFAVLSKGKWNQVGLNRKSDCVISGSTISCNSPVVPDNAPPLNNLFNMDSDNPTALAPQTFYQYFKKADKSNKLPYNPNIQNQPVTALTDQTNSGFLKMTLASPTLGFGNQIYPQVVSQVALYNASALVNTIAGSPKVVAAPNAPFAPTLKAFSGSYSATQSYTFDYNYDANSTDSIIECYHYNAFENYLVYDSTRPPANYKNEMGLPVIGLQRNMQGIALYPALPCEAVMFFELTQVLAPNSISFYFELAESNLRVPDQDYTLDYLYLSKTGWNSLKVLSDSTHGLTCSGLLVFDFKADFNDKHVQMPADSFWCAILLNKKANPMSVAKTTFLQSNGVKLTRTGTSYLTNATAPQIAADQIAGPADAIPQISTTVQPFESYGGKGAEDKADRNLRVASRLKTKNRAVTSGDYKRIIAENFDDVFYSKLWFDQSKRAIEIYLVKNVPSAQSKNAFLPLVSTCLEKEVTSLLNTVSGSSAVKVQNFNLQYLKVTATVFISPDYDEEITALRLTQALKIFLSPWIKSDSPQIPIDQGITDVQISSFFLSFNEVTEVKRVKFKLTTSDKDGKPIPQKDPGKVESFDPSVLIVPNICQQVTCKTAV